MKKLLYIIFGVMGALMFIQCSDWTEMEPKFTEPVNIKSIRNPIIRLFSAGTVNGPEPERI